MDETPYLGLTIFDYVDLFYELGFVNITGLEIRKSRMKPETFTPDYLPTQTAEWVHDTDGFRPAIYIYLNNGMVLMREWPRRHTFVVILRLLGPSTSPPKPSFCLRGFELNYTQCWGRVSNPNWPNPHS